MGKWRGCKSETRNTADDTGHGGDDNLAEVELTRFS